MICVSPNWRLWKAGIISLKSSAHVLYDGWRLPVICDLIPYKNGGIVIEIVGVNPKRAWAVDKNIRPFEIGECLLCRISGLLCGGSRCLHVAGLAYAGPDGEPKLLLAGRIQE